MGASNSRHSISTKNYLTVPAGEYPCGNNLYLIVTETGARRWLFRFQRNGVKDSMGFGSARDVTFKEAVDKAIDARRLLAKGTNPKESRDEERRAAKGKVKFGPFATAWCETYKASLKHKASRSKLTHLVNVHFKPLHDLYLDEITTDELIQNVLKPLAAKVEIARDARQRLKLIFDAAIADDHRKDNPADYNTKLRPKMGRAPKRGRVRGHHKGISHDALPALLTALGECPDQSARALEVVALTVARTAEVRHMKWTQLDLDGGLWDLKASDIPANDDGGDGEGTKNEYDRLTPLSRQALAFLRELHAVRVSDYVFPGRDLDGPMSNNTLLKKLKDISGDPTLTVHGLRGTFRTWAQEETDFEEEIVEHCMHHITGDEAEKAYKHGSAVNKRRKVLQAWADFALKPAAKVIELDRAA
jgi:integrase